MDQRAGQLFPRPADGTAAGPTRRAVRLRILWLFGLALVGALTGLQIPREIGRWQLASALSLRSKGEKEAAYEKLNSAINWFPQNADLLLQRAEWRLADGQRDEALADCDRMLEASGTNPELLQLHSQFLQNAGEFRRAASLTRNNPERAVLLQRAAECDEST